MQSELYAQAITKVLTDESPDYLVYRSLKPEETISLCRSTRANVLVMEVTRQGVWRLDGRIQLLRELRSSESGQRCKVLLLVDEKADALLAADVRQAVKDQLADNFIYASISPTYLAGVIDTL